MKPRLDLAIEDVDGELIVLDKQAGKVHQLNSSASFVWSCLSDGLATDEIAAMLSEAFELDPDSAVDDVRTVIANFKELKLVVE